MYLSNIVNLDVTFTVLVLNQLIARFLSLSVCLCVLLLWTLYCHSC